MNVRYGICSLPKKRTVLLNGIRFFNTPKNNSQHYFLSKFKGYLKAQKLCSNIGLEKKYSTEPEKEDSKNVKLPPLMNSSPIIWPSIIRSFKNVIFSYFIIKPYMDHDFDLNEFILGSKKAVHASINIESNEYFLIICCRLFQKNLRVEKT